MRKLVTVVFCCIGLILGSGAALAGAAPSAGGSAGKACIAEKKEIGNIAFRARYRDPDGRHAMQNCRAQHS